MTSTSVTVATNSKLDSYLLSKCTITSNSKKLVKIKVNDNGNAKFTSQEDNDLTPIKTGEVFRNKMGKFTFICTCCHCVFYRCDEMMNHINSHFSEKSSFDHVNIEMSEPRSVLPADVTDDPLQLEEADIVTNGTFQDLTNLKSQPKPNVLSVKNEVIDVDGEPKPPKTTVIRLIKVPASQAKPGITNKNLSKINSQLSNCLQVNYPTKFVNLGIAKKESGTTSSDECKTIDLAEQKKPIKTTVIKLIKVPISKIKELKRNNFTKKFVKPEIETPPEANSPPSGLKSIFTDEPQPKLKKSDDNKESSLNNVRHISNPALVRRIVRSKCYQCEMEPKIYNESDARRHICLFCPNWFANHDEFESHAIEVHKRDPNFVRCSDFYCYVCEKQFPFRNYLTSHLKVHIENKDHLCATCGSTFRTLSRLTEHMKAHNNLTYECDKCDKKFSRFDRFRRHLWCHNTDLSYICHICSKAFKMKMYLKRHMAIHNEVKINCRYCDASFNFATVRRAHERSRHNVV